MLQPNTYIQYNNLRIRNVLKFSVFFLKFLRSFELLKSNWPSKPMKMTFLLFCVIILNDTRFFSTSFAVHCCLVWCVGVPQSFFTVHNECGTKILAPLKSKKNFQTSAEIPFELCGGLVECAPSPTKLVQVPTLFTVGLHTTFVSTK